MKTTITLTAEAYQRLNVHAAMTRKEKSEVVEDLITTHLRRFVVSDRAPEAGEQPGKGRGEADG